MANRESLIVVLVALGANIALAIVKFIGYLLTASPSMLAETYHSISDSGNQIILLIGMFYTDKAATDLHPFGYGKATFFYAFIVSVLLFGIAGWESVKHGIDALRQLRPVTDGVLTIQGVTFPAVYINYGVLLLTILFDGISYVKARQKIAQESIERGWRNLPEAFRKTSDMPVLAVLTENAVAGIAAGVALVAIFLSQVTNNPVYDAAGAVVIGLLLMLFAIALGWENKKLLLGEALPPRQINRLRRLVAESAGVRNVVDFRTVYFGPDTILVTVDVSLDPDLDTVEIDATINDIEAKLRHRDPRIKKIYIEPEY